MSWCVLFVKVSIIGLHAAFASLSGHRSDQRLTADSRPNEANYCIFVLGLVSPTLLLLRARGLSRCVKLNNQEKRSSYASWRGDGPSQLRSGTETTLLRRSAMHQSRRHDRAHRSHLSSLNTKLGDPESLGRRSESPGRISPAHMKAVEATPSAFTRA